MDSKQISTLKLAFDEIVHMTDDGVEYWYAREIQSALGYLKWDKFQNVIEKAKSACKSSGNSVQDHFLQTGKMVSIGSGAERKIEDIMLTRYACYLVAMNGDSSKSEIAFAQTYFALQTRKQELLEQRLADLNCLRYVLLRRICYDSGAYCAEYSHFWCLPVLSLLGRFFAFKGKNKGKLFLKI